MNKNKNYYNSSKPSKTNMDYNGYSKDLNKKKQNYNNYNYNEEMGLDYEANRVNNYTNIGGLKTRNLVEKGEEILKNTTQK